MGRHNGAGVIVLALVAALLGTAYGLRCNNGAGSARVPFDCGSSVTRCWKMITGGVMSYSCGVTSSNEPVGCSSQTTGTTKCVCDTDLCNGTPPFKSATLVMVLAALAPLALAKLVDKP